jgi:hypothetical protein
MNQKQGYAMTLMRIHTSSEKAETWLALKKRATL